MSAGTQVGVAAVIETPTLVYQVTFANGAATVGVNTIGAPQLWVGATAVFDEDPHPLPGPLGHLREGGGLRLQITKTGNTPVIVICALAPAPPGLRRFRMVANYTLAESGLSPSELGAQWAPILVARDGDKTTITSQNTIVGATHQVRHLPDDPPGVHVALGVAKGQSANPSIKSELVKVEAAYGSLPWAFTLEADIDCYAGTGKARLATGGHAGSPTLKHVWTEKTFQHQLVTQIGTHFPSPVAAVGVGLGINQGTGTAAVIVNDFSIYAWSGPAPLDPIGPQ